MPGQSFSRRTLSGACNQSSLSEALGILAGDSGDAFELVKFTSTLIELLWIERPPLNILSLISLHFKRDSIFIHCRNLITVVESLSVS